MSLAAERTLVTEPLVNQRMVRVPSFFRGQELDRDRGLRHEQIPDFFHLFYFGRFG